MLTRYCTKCPRCKRLILGYSEFRIRLPVQAPRIACGYMDSIHREENSSPILNLQQCLGSLGEVIMATLTPCRGNASKHPWVPCDVYMSPVHIAAANYGPDAVKPRVL